MSRTLLHAGRRARSDTESGNGGVTKAMRTVRRIMTGALAALPVFAIALVWSAAPAYADADVAFKITDSRITESSGLAADPDRNVYWTVNDSGDGGRVFALDDSGKVEGTINFRADVVDVEAVAYHNGSIYIGDIGDNDGNRQSITVYQLSQTEPNNSTVLYHAFDFAYPDGAHDAETMLISDSGQISFVTKGAKGAIYQAPKNPSRQQVNTLTKVADAPPYVTDGTVLRDGKIALRSYVDVKIIDPDDDDRVVGQAATPFQPQGESVTTALDGDALLVGSEGKNSVVYTMTVPDKVGTAPSASSNPPTASASPQPSASPSKGPAADANDDTEDTGSTSPGRGGTTVAILIAAGVAIAAGGAVYLRTRRSS